MTFEQWAKRKFKKLNVEPPENEKEWFGALEDLLDIDPASLAVMEGVTFMNRIRIQI